MEYIDKNGSFVQRRKMYIGLPLHNMKSKVEFDWQNNDISFQDQVGTKFKLKQQGQQIKRKYEETLNKKIYSKYVQHRDDNYYIPPNPERQTNQNDILSKELEHFNHSKIITPTPQKNMELPPQNNQNQMQQRYQRGEKLDASYNGLNQSQNLRQFSPNNSPQRHIRQSSYEGGNYQRQKNQEEEQVKYRYNRPYNPKNYATLNPATDRYQPFEPYPISYNRDYSSPIRGDKYYSGSVPNSYPLRNVIPDKLQTHLRERVKADNKAVKVTLNLFDYHKR